MFHLEKIIIKSSNHKRKKKKNYMGKGGRGNSGVCGLYPKPTDPHDVNRFSPEVGGLLLLQRCRNLH